MPDGVVVPGPLPCASTSSRCQPLSSPTLWAIRCEDRVRAAKATGLRNLPFHDFDANRVWLAVVALAMDLTVWMQTLALHDHQARRWEPKTLRLRLFSIPARLARHARRVHLRLSAHNPWTTLTINALTRLAAP